MMNAHKKYVSQFTMMGTVISLTLFKPNQKAIEDVYDYLQRMDHIFSANRLDSEIAEVNRCAGKRPVIVSAECFRLTREAIAYSKQYSDSFNVLIGPFVKLWKIGFGGSQIPTELDIKRKLDLLNLNKVIFEEERLSIYLRKPGMQLDLGAIAKGYFADQIVKQLKRFGIVSAIVNLGGNVKILGSNPLTNNHRWQVGIQAPEAPRGYPLLKVEMPARTVVTSGIFERYFEIGHKRYHHILNPSNGYPVKNDVDQVTVITEQSELAEVLSTVAYFKGPVLGCKLIEKIPNTEAIFINHAKKVTATKGLRLLSEGVFTIE